MERKSISPKEIFKAGIITQNPVLRSVLGMCPTLAVTTSAQNGLGMGMATTAVLICSNLVISALKRLIPDKVRIPVYIVIIAGFVSMLQLVVKAYAPGLDQSLGIFLPLIVVNCIVFGRAESFARKQRLWPAVLDGLASGLGFTLVLVLMGMVREFLGMGTVFGQVLNDGQMFEPMLIFVMPPGGFLVFGFLVAAANQLALKKGKAAASHNCSGCPAAGNCPSAKKGEC